MYFIITAGLMLVFAVAFVILPLLRKRAVHAKQDQPSAASRLARRLDELQADLASGLLDQAQFDRARADLEAEIEHNEKLRAAQAAPITYRRSWMVTGISTILIAGISIALYATLGNWHVAIEGKVPAEKQQFQHMVEKLSYRLHTSDRDDLKGWEMLGRTYLVMGRYPKAVDAFANAYRITGDSDTYVLVSYAEAMTLADPTSLLTKAAPLFEKVLKVEPDNAKALWYGGVVALENGNNKLAVSRWNHLLGVAGLPPEYRNIVEQRIRAAGGKVTAIPAVSAGNQKITVDVSITAALKSIVKPGATVFVLARAPGAANAPPLAVKRFTVADLPRTVTLTKQDAMVPGRDISAFPTVEIVARVAPDGKPLPQPGDAQGSVTVTMSKANKPVTLVIDHKIN